MGKGRQRPPMYNRQSAGYQQNMQKYEMKRRDIKIPKQPDQKKLAKITRIGAIAWVIIAVLLVILVGAWTLIPMIIIAGAALGALLLYMRDFEKKYVTAYKKMGMPKDMFMKQLKKSGSDARAIARVSKTWDKTKVDL